MYKTILKPFFDIIIALIGFIILSPLFLLVFLLMTYTNKGNPFFYQVRPGKNERIFKVIKFKTMNDKKDGKGELLPDSVRLTRVGKFVRKTSLDEIPQLINVLKGDMSLIGPRPLLPQYIELYNDEQKKRHNVKPGITGWAQINGRNNVTWKKKFELDVWYVNNLSFILDLKIFFKTFEKVFKTEGVNKEGSVTTEYFDGNN